MTLSWIDNDLLADLEVAALNSARNRQHLNLHSDYRDPAQRLVNHVGVESYIRPHKHSSTQAEETLVAIRGLFGLLTFDDGGKVQEARCFGSELYEVRYGCALAVVLQPDVWHTAVALTPGAVLFECKAGPFDPLAAKDPAPWAPEEGASTAAQYLEILRSRVAPAFAHPGP